MRSSVMLRETAIGAAVVAALASGACGSADRTQLNVEVDETPEAAFAAETIGVPFAEAGSWEGESSGGTLVTVTTSNVPVCLGPLSLNIVIRSDSPEPLPVSVDLVSPEMPMHGIRRFDAEAISPTQYTVNLEIPMEGRWLLYVNLDAGVNAASFELHVPPPEEAESVHQH
ncbi:MAG: hypothetical protein O7E50_07880 [Gemmatimonadetes bacterium]|nr:hypothetical protein [Gemmatimonadota bacterium]